ncbi:Tat pathway signal sequence domain protein [Streptomyces albus subsp. chlorinus]|nr:Tat pathway signal sequence domain protein [Streptomyces albus subsp. chlorinus]
MVRLAGGTVLALAATAGLLSVTLPLSASGDTRERDTSTVEDGARREGPPAKVEDAPPVTGRGIGRDPLSDSERGRAVRIALSGEGGGTSLRTAREDVTGKKGTPQLLATDLSEDAEAGRPRRAEVSFYDYADDALIHRTVDLDVGKVTGTDTSRGSQPPPAWAEAHEAAELLLKDPLGAGLRADYRRAAGKKLTRAGQLGTQGLTYVPHTERGDALDACGKQRCVRLFTRVAGGGPWIDTQRFVINLSDRTVHRLGPR